MDCKRVNKLIQDFVDESLDAAEHRQVRKHIDGCGSCAGELRSLEMLITSLDTMELEPAPVRFADRVIERLRQSGRIATPVVDAQRAGFFGWSRRRFNLPLATAALLLFAVILSPATIGLLEGMVGKSTVFVTDTYLEVQERATEVGVLTRFADALEKNLRMLKTILLAGFSLLAQAGEMFMVPALVTILLLTLGILLLFRGSQRRSAQHAAFSF